MAGPQPQRVSSLVLDEFFASGDDRFVETLRGFHDPKKLIPLVERWKKDPRPSARAQILTYLDLPLNSPGHHPVIKRLFKQAEADGDLVLLAAFLVAFDRLVRRVRRKTGRCDRSTRSFVTWEALAAPRNSILQGAPATFMNRQGQTFEVLPPTNRRLFKYRTRDYLRRRAWRYFRRMGFQRPDDYVAAVAGALLLYRDDDVAAGENVLDSWGLVHICFGKDPSLAIGPSRINLQAGKAFGDVNPAPQFPALWQKPESATVLISLVLSARSRLVRVWATMMLRAHHAGSLAAISADDLLRLLDHDDEEVQQFGASLLENSEAIPRLPIDTWLRLLRTRNLSALSMIVAAMERHVMPDRFNLAQCVDLATARAVPVARYGLRLAQTRRPVTADELELIARLSAVQAASIAKDATAWALSILGTPERYDVDRISRFFDSLLKEVRQAAWDWLTPQSPGFGDPALWSRMIETPYDDVRLNLVAALESRLRKRTNLSGSIPSPGIPGAGKGEGELQRTPFADRPHPNPLPGYRERGQSRARPAPPDLAADRLASVWISVLLGIHRGGRKKLSALRQISDAIQNDPASAETLLPVLTVAIRSVRPTEARAGLAAIISAIDARPELAARVATLLPELRLTEAGA